MSSVLALPVSSRFHVESISSRAFTDEQVETIKKVAIGWQKLARLFAEHKSSSQPIFDDASQMAQSLMNLVSLFRSEQMPELSPKVNSELLLCKDTSENIQAMSVVEISLTQINMRCLLTHPNNIRSPLTDHLRVAGAGSAIIHYLKERIEKSESIQEIALTALGSAVQFYKKHNFLILGTLYFDVFDEEGPSEESLYTDMSFPKEVCTNKSVA